MKATDEATLEKVHAALVDLVTLHLNTLESTGERERFFAKHRIRFYEAGSTPKIVQLRLPVDEGAYVHTHKVPLSKVA